MALGDEQIDRAATRFDQVLKTRIEQMDSVFDSKLDRFQEMLNGIKVTTNLEMPVVKKAEPVDQ